MNFNPSNLSAIILDRDGVINVETGNYVQSVDELRLIPTSLEAIARLSVSAAFRPLVSIQCWT